MATRIVAPQDFGGPEQLALTRAPTPEPQAGGVRVAVRAVGVNPIEWKLCSGAFGTSPGLHALETVHLDGGETLLLHGAAGGVGGLAVQLGAEPVAHGDGLEQRVLDLAPDGADAAIDAGGSDEALETSVALVADRSRIVTLAGFARVAELGIVGIGGGPGVDPGTAVRAAAVPQVLDLLARGEVELPVARTYPLEETAQAHLDSMEGHTRGKLVVLPRLVPGLRTGLRP